MPSDRHSALIEKTFRAPVFHTCGCREFMLIRAECEMHRGYHTSADQLVVEVADYKHRLLEQGVGDVLITDLHNVGMPFVRYVNGDLAAAGRSGTREDLFTLHVVKRSAPSEADMRYRRFEIHKLMGAGMTVEFLSVDEIALTPSGKRRVTVRDIPEPTGV